MSRVVRSSRFVVGVWGIVVAACGSPTGPASIDGGRPDAPPALVDGGEIPDAPIGVDAPDAPSCTPETDTVLCSRAAATCGDVTETDRCGETRTIACGVCGATDVCTTANVCVCAGETDAELCAAAEVECGEITADDRCGASRTVSCADTCSAGTTCGGAWIENLCGSTTCTADGWCRATRATFSSVFDFKAIWLPASDWGWVAGADSFHGGHVYLWNGELWRHVASTSRDLRAVTGTSTSDAWIAGGYGDGWRQEGDVLEPVGVCSTCDVWDMWAVGPADVWATGYDHQVLHFDGSGWSVERVSPASGAPPHAIWAEAGGDVWIVGAGGTLRRRHEGEWSSTTEGTAALNGVWGASDDDVWAVGAAGRVIHFDGARWSAVESGTTSDLRSVAGSSSSDVWIAGDDGTVLRWDGETLVREDSGTTRAILSVWAVAGDDVWAAGEGGLLLHRGPSPDA